MLLNIVMLTITKAEYLILIAVIGKMRNVCYTDRTLTMKGFDSILLKEYYNV